MKTKKCLCDACGGLRFDIIVEPDLSEAYAPSQGEWLKNASTCPVCGNEVEEIESEESSCTGN